jgi:predicted ATP-dependent serine protease
MNLKYRSSLVSKSYQQSHVNVKLNGTYTMSPEDPFGVYSKQRLKLTYTASEERSFSGGPGLDERIRSGFIKGTTTAIIWTSGTAKPTFAFQFIAEGVTKGEPGIFYSVEENEDAIRIMAKSYGYNISSRTSLYSRNYMSRGVCYNHG